MDVIDLGCSVLRTPFIEWFMTVVGYFGRGLAGGMAALLLLAHGYAYSNERTKRAGIAVLIAIIVAGMAAQVLKEFVAWPRPGFPSGHTGAAFALASVLTTTFPALGPLFYMLAVLAAVSRLYFRADFIWDVLGGAVIGLSAGISTAHKLVTRSPREEYSPLRLAAWTSVAAVGIAALTFFNSMENKIGRFMVVPDAPHPAPVIATFDFGTPEARNLLRYGWSVDERWLNGAQSVVWAHGLASEITMNLPAVQDYRFRFRVSPYAPKGPACQTVEVKLNHTPVAKISLERGWHNYEIIAPKTAIRSGNNSIRFFYNYAESPKSRNRSADERALSVAFDKIEAFSTR